MVMMLTILLVAFRQISTIVSQQLTIYSWKKQVKKAETVNVTSTLWFLIMKQLSHSNAQFITKKNIISLQRESNLLYLIWIIFKLVLTKKLQFYLKKTMKKQKKFRITAVQVKKWKIVKNLWLKKQTSMQLVAKNSMI